MNRRLFTILVIITCFTGGSIFAQDTLVTKKGKTLLVKILSAKFGNVDYKLFEDPSNCLFTIKSERVRAIKYESVKVDTLPLTEERIRRNMQLKGIHDADVYYNKYQGARAGTIVTTVATAGIGGVVPAILCSKAPPAPQNLGCPDPKLMENEHYNAAYKKEAKKIKTTNVWAGFGMGVLVDIGLGIIIALARK